ncbi:MAG TPA: metalloregulator ArsR/SmtB family transcription factor [Acidobacteriota bacterium]|nr:metalloregulator ArsR/SmtB family transcription factor [Acidobacteriota bacterium]
MEEYKDRLYGQFALIGRALSSPKRLEILELLSQGERSVEDLAHETESSVSNVSQHLQNLRAARLVEARKDGLYVRYRLADEAVGAFWRSLQSLAIDRSAEAREIVSTFIDQRDQFEPVGYDELLARAEKGDVVVLDVRSGPEYAAGHIPNAQSIPLNELADRLGELPGDCEIVAYCRGTYCLLSVDAVLLLRQNGLTARRLAGGLPQWRAEGFPVVGGEKNNGADTPHNNEVLR